MPRLRTKRRHSFTDDRRGPRLQRVLAEAGVGSRRHCEALIEEGAVTVNGEVVDALPAWVDPARDRIVVQGRVLPRAERHVYAMLYKPKGVVSTNDDPEGRRRAIDLVRHPSGARLYPVGRLDIDSSGLLLLTNDGELANRLTHPRYEMHKVYEVTVGGFVPDGDLQHLEAGIYLPGPRGAPGARTERSSLRIVKRDRTRTMLLMELREGRNRQIRRMLQRFGHPVKKLRRVQMGPLRLRGIAVGQWRDLTSAELAELRREAFRTPAQRRQRAERERRAEPSARAEPSPSAGRERRAERETRAEPSTRAGASEVSRGVEPRRRRLPPVGPGRPSPRRRAFRDPR